MNKYIVKNCPALSYGKGLRFKKCYRTNWKEYCKDCSDCVIKRIVGLCEVNNCPCDNCDGVGYFDGCKDTDCSFYRLMQIETLLEIEEVNE